ncbi:MAG: DUF2147 domain-containing protein [Cytophagales bacterium]
MKTKLIVALIIAISFGGFAQDQVIGIYFTPEKDGKIQIYKEGNKYFGKIISIPNNNRKDDKNPDEKLRSRSVIGLVLLQNFEYKNGQWQNGTIYDVDSGTLYSSTLWFDGNDLKKLNLRGFVGISLFGRTATLERVP